MPGSLEERYIILEVIISGKHIKVPSGLIPAGIYVSINVDSRDAGTTATKVLSSEESVVWGSTVTLSCASPALSIEIRASYELIGKIKTSWDKLLDDGDEAFSESILPTCLDIHPSLTLKAGVVHTCNEQDSTLSDPLVDCGIGRETDAGHARFAEYITSGTVSHLNDAVQHFQLVLNQCPVALTNLAVACLEGYIQNDLQDIDTTTSLLRKALALRSQGHPDHASSLHNLESTALCCKLLPLCPEGTYLRSICVDSEVGYVIDSIHLRRNMLELYPLGQQHHESIHLHREAVSLCLKPASITKGNLVTLMKPSLCMKKRCSLLGTNFWGSLIAPSIIVTPHLATLPSRSKPDMTNWVLLIYIANLFAWCSALVSRTLRRMRIRPICLVSGFYTTLLIYSNQGILLKDSHHALFSHIIGPLQRSNMLLDAHLATRSTLPVDAPSRAVELVEQGRGQQCPVEDLDKLISNAAQSSAIITDRVYRKLRRQWENAVAEIRDLRGFSRFLLPPLAQSSSSLPETPFMFPVGNTRGISHEPKRAEDRSHNHHHSRIWLCPTAAFTSIPLHAAHPFKTNADRSKEPCLEDLYICSYTPTLSALKRQPGAGRGKALLAVDSELELVQKFVPATATPTRAEHWVHLACHGKQDPDQPYNSHFVMRDEHLTLLDIMERDVPHAEFAFLSACHTAVGDEETPDEVIHLAAGLQFSGFKSVIGTLWEVNDAVAKHVVEAFYKNMFDPKYGGVMDCTKAAWALNCATHAVKTKVPLEQRMVFIHIGV
ncbi:CHAT domain-containing protein [Suillus spraguei]|nr:CHAT domain-containing protein [Suillus spraguei]